PHSDRQQMLFINTTRWQLTDNILLKNTFAYRKNQYSTQINTGGTGPLLAGPGAPFVIFHANSDINKTFLTNEIQLQGESFGGKLEWILGGFYNKDKPDGINGSQFQIFDVAVPGPHLNFSTQHTTEKNTALFGQVGIDLSSLVQ